MPTRWTRFSILLVLSSVLLVSTADAQEPQDAPPGPEWSVDLVNHTMVLTPLTSRLALGLSSTPATLGVYGKNVDGEPGSGYLVLGSHLGLHMKLDRNDLQVAGGQAGTVGSLYLQRYGGPLVVHGSMEMARRIYVSQEGKVGVGTADPKTYGVAHGFAADDWPDAPIVAVDGDIYYLRSFSDEVRVLKKLRVGERIDQYPGGAYDEGHTDAIAMIGGKLTAQEIVVHISEWADDVFDDDYELMTLAEVESAIEREGHLPGLPSAAEVQKEGLDLAVANALLLRKVEELTLYAIEQEKQKAALEERLERLEGRLDALEGR